MLERGKQISLLRDYVFFCHELEQPDLFFPGLETHIYLTLSSVNAQRGQVMISEINKVKKKREKY